MNMTAVFHISLEMWGIAICIIASLAMFVEKRHFTNNRILRICMQALCILLLLNDSTAWFFRGRPGQMAYYAVRISNCAVYILNLTYMSLFTLYQWRVINRQEKPAILRMYIVYALSITGILLMVYSQFTGVIYYVDSNNFYHRGPWYIVTQIIAITAMILDFTIIMQYRKKLDISIFWALMCYYILPAISTVILVFYYGLSLQSLSLVISTQIMFVMDLNEVRRNLNESRDKYIKASLEAKHDAMTGLWNKIAGISRIDKAMEEIDGLNTAALFFVDIDNFKMINDTYGHAAGDYWIKTVAEIINSECEHMYDTACRFGGDEFVLFLENIHDEKFVSKKVNHIYTRLHNKAIERGQEVHCSIGVCCILDNEHTVQECLDIADSALYESKRRGKQTCVIYSTKSQVGQEAGEISDATGTTEKIFKLVNSRLGEMYTFIARIDSDTWDCRILKNLNGENQFFNMSNDYEKRITQFAKENAAKQSQADIEGFLSRERMKGQTELMDSLKYYDKNDRPGILHLMSECRSDECDRCRYYIIAVQKLYLEADAKIL